MKELYNIKVLPSTQRKYVPCLIRLPPFTIPLNIISPTKNEKRQEREVKIGR